MSKQSAPLLLQLDAIDSPSNLQVLQVSARELRMCDNLYLAISLLRDLHDLPKVANAPIDLDLVVEEFLKG